MRLKSNEIIKWENELKWNEMKKTIYRSMPTKKSFLKIADKV